MSRTTLIANGTVVAADGEFDGDVLIEGEKIAAVGSVVAPEGAHVVDASGCFVLPGLIDNHTHLSMPFMGTMSSDDYNTGTQAAAAGGVTCLVDFAIQQHPDDLQSTLDEWRGRAASRRALSGDQAGAGGPDIGAARPCPRPRHARAIFGRC